MPVYPTQAPECRAKFSCNKLANIVEKFLKHSVVKMTQCGT